MFSLGLNQFQLFHGALEGEGEAELTSCLKFTTPSLGWPTSFV
jgi:hypothetical protein